MTFLEAAIEVLRTAEDPLHFKEIARQAVERKLLSHVGRDPNAAMQSCLNQAVRSKVHDGLVMRSKPGHYRLRAGVALPELPPPPSEPEPLPVAEEAADPAKPKRKKSSKNKKKARSSSKSDKKSSKKKSSKSSSKKTSKSSSKKTRGKSKAKAKDDEEREDDGSSAKTKKKAKKAKKSKAKTAGKTKTKTKKAAKTTAKKSKKGRKKTSKRASKGEAPPEDDDEDRGDEQDAPELVFDVPEGGPDSPMPMPDLDPSKVRFRGPEGSGLEEDTDVALVMANAMSRLVEERPELREELEAMQKGQAPEPEVIEIGRKKRRDDKDDDRGDDRGGGGGRRRRRRRRKSRRVDWSSSGSTESIESRSEELLDKVGAVLAEAGPRSLHVRQIAESLASQDVLGGDISEIERAVTAAILLDVHRRGEASRFAVRGDARYQLRGSRVPEKAAAAEYAARSAIRTLEQETEKQLLLWLQSLGARSLESLVRIWLAREDYNLVATLPPSRGLGKLVVDDPDPDDDDGRTLVLIVPRKTSLEPKLWDGEAERNKCAQTMVFAMCEPINDSSIGDTRVIFAPELTRWLLRNGIGVRTIRFEVPVLDAGLIESIAGLDT